MARLTITVYRDAKQVGFDRPLQTISRSITAGSQQSLVISGDSGQMMYCRFCADADCDFVIGADPTAIAGTSPYLPANSTEYFGILAGDKVAVIEHV